MRIDDIGVIGRNHLGQVVGGGGGDQHVHTHSKRGVYGGYGYIGGDETGC